MKKKKNFLAAVKNNIYLDGRLSLLTLLNPLLLLDFLYGPFFFFKLYSCDSLFLFFPLLALKHFYSKYSQNYIKRFFLTIWATTYHFTMQRPKNLTPEEILKFFSNLDEEYSEDEENGRVSEDVGKIQVLILKSLMMKVMQGVLLWPETYLPLKEYWNNFWESHILKKCHEKR